MDRWRMLGSAFESQIALQELAKACEVGDRSLALDPA